MHHISMIPSMFSILWCVIMVNWLMENIIFWQPCSWCFGDKSTQSFLFVLIYTSQFFGNDVLPQWLSIIHFSPNCSLVLETLVLNIVLVIQNLTSMKFLSWTMHAIIAVMLPSWIIIQKLISLPNMFLFHNFWQVLYTNT